MEGVPFREHDGVRRSELTDDLVHRVRLTRHHHRIGAVHRGQAHVLARTDGRQRDASATRKATILPAGASWRS